MSKKIAAVYSIIVGICMIGLWAFLLASGNVPELKSELVRITLHIISEILTGVFLLFSGIGLVKKKKWAENLFLLSAGALIYSVLNAAGYYAQIGNPAMIIMFTVIFVIAVPLSCMFVRDKRMAAIK